ncbi:MAG TPA: hypothetical protein DEP46_18740 [Blastocatellia bacterium]|nr:hypothetical protein [Blastocatellia bacterium]
MESLFERVTKVILSYTKTDSVPDGSRAIKSLDFRASKTKTKGVLSYSNFHDPASTSEQINTSTVDSNMIQITFQQKILTD